MKVGSEKNAGCQNARDESAENEHLASLSLALGSKPSTRRTLKIGVKLVSGVWKTLKQRKLIIRSPPLDTPPQGLWAQPHQNLNRSKQFTFRHPSFGLGFLGWYLLVEKRRRLSVGILLCSVRTRKLHVGLLYWGKNLGTHYLTRNMIHRSIGWKNESSVGESRSHLIGETT